MESDVIIGDISEYYRIEVVFYAMEAEIQTELINQTVDELCLYNETIYFENRLFHAVFVRFDHFLNHLTADRTSLFSG